MSVSSLSTSLINLNTLRQAAKNDLEEILKAVAPAEVPKVLVLDPQLIALLANVVPSSFLKDRSVSTFMLNSSTFDHDCQNIVYITRPQMGLMRWISDQIKHFVSKPQVGGEPKRIFVYLVPRRNFICEKIFEEEGVYDHITKLGEFSLDLIPFDDDLLSMELPLSFREVHLEGDHSSLYYTARALMKLQSLYGVFANIKYLGASGKSVADMMLRMKQQVGSEVLNAATEIDSLVLIDRSVDLVTPMLTPLTYEALVDELFEIKNGLIDNIFEGPEKKGKIPLNNNDKVFETLRKLHINAVGKGLNKKAIEVNEEYEKRHNLQSSSDFKKFKEQIPEIVQMKQNVERHLNIASSITKHIQTIAFRKKIETEQTILAGDDEQATLDYIEECINKQEPLSKILRLICLFSQVNNGFKPKVYEYFRRELLQSYGYDIMLTLNNFETTGMFKSNEGFAAALLSRSGFPSLRKGLKLLNQEGVEEVDPRTLAHTFSVFAPLSIKLVEEAFAQQTGWKNIESLIAHIPHGDDAPNGRSEVVSRGGGKPLTLVFFIGGITFAEANALRWLSSVSERAYIIATTKIINGNSFLSTMYDHTTRAQHNQQLPIQLATPAGSQAASASATPRAAAASPSATSLPAEASTSASAEAAVAE